YFGTTVFMLIRNPHPYIDQVNAPGFILPEFVIGINRPSVSYSWSGMRIDTCANIISFSPVHYAIQLLKGGLNKIIRRLLTYIWPHYSEQISTCYCQNCVQLLITL